MRTLGIQHPPMGDLIEQLMADNQRLTDELAELRAAQRNHASYTIKIYADEEGVQVKTGAFIFAVPQDVDGLYLEFAEAFVSTTGSTATEVWINNLTRSQYMFDQALIIAAGEEHSNPEYILDNTALQVFWKNQLSIDVEEAGTGAKGLGVSLGFQ